jgi:hypothetical protein
MGDFSWKNEEFKFVCDADFFLDYHLSCFTLVWSFRFNFFQFVIASCGKML